MAETSLSMMKEDPASVPEEPEKDILLRLILVHPLPKTLSADVHLRIRMFFWVSLALLTIEIYRVVHCYLEGYSVLLHVISSISMSVNLAAVQYLRTLKWTCINENQLIVRMTTFANCIAAVFIVPILVSNFMQGGFSGDISTMLMPAIPFSIVLITGSWSSCTVWTLVNAMHNILLAHLWSTSHEWPYHATTIVHVKTMADRQGIARSLRISLVPELVLYLIARGFVLQARGYNRLFKQQNTALLKMNKRAKDALLSQREFLANMSHEFRTPLTHILAFAELLWDTDLTEDQREMLSTLISSAKTLLALINDVLDLSKIKAHKMELERINLSLRRLIFDVLRSVSVSAHAKGNEVVAKISPLVPNTLVGDPVRLRQILLNLCGNAVKFTKNGHVVISIDVISVAADNRRHSSRRDSVVSMATETVLETTERGFWETLFSRTARVAVYEPAREASVRRQSIGPARNVHKANDNQVMIRFRVQDSGCGMTPEEMGQIFEEFKQAQGSTTRKFGGTGLGLSISRRLVQAMDGNLSATSTGKGFGSTFSFDLLFDIGGVDIDRSSFGSVSASACSRKSGQVSGKALNLFTKKSSTGAAVVAGATTKDNSSRSTPKTPRTPRTPRNAPGSALGSVERGSGGSRSRNAGPKTSSLGSRRQGFGNHRGSYPSTLNKTTYSGPEIYGIDNITVSLFDDVQVCREAICQTISELGGYVVPEEEIGFGGFDDAHELVQYVQLACASSNTPPHVIMIDVGKVGIRHIGSGSGDSSSSEHADMNDDRDRVSTTSADDMLTPGWRAVQIIRDSCPKIPIIAMSDHLKPCVPPIDVKNKANRIALVTKPISEVNIDYAVRALLWPASDESAGSISDDDENMPKKPRRKRRGSLLSVERQRKAVDSESTGPMHILIVDDNNINLKVMSRVLEKLGHTSQTAISGKVALEILSQSNFCEDAESTIQPFDVVLSDVMMPEMSGYELSVKIHQLSLEKTNRSGKKSLPVFAVTAASTVDVYEACRENGMTRIISKPYTTQQLNDVLHDVARLSRRRPPTVIRDLQATAENQPQYAEVIQLTTDE